MVSQIHRRLFLKRLGGGAVAVEVFGIVACSPEQTSETATPTGPTTEATVAGDSPRFSSDMSQAEATLFKLAELEFDVVLFGHGSPVLTGASAQVAALVAGL